ncbi:MAG: chromate transporter, partial [Verrucomicrobia bacterium]|nr:chromate transporter [Verrucomicrobiota bacterium]
MGVTQTVSFRAALKVWCKIALLSFGGPAGQIAVMHRILVSEKRWISENRFLHALNYCMLLPGPEAQQLATYIGWLLHRTRGGLVAGTLFILPGFLSILALSVLYAGYHDMTVVNGLFYGLKPAVVAVVMDAVLRIGKRSLKNRAMVLLAVVAFVAIFFFQMPFPAIILAAALIGYLGGKVRPDIFMVLKCNAPPDAEETDRSISDRQDVADRPGMARTIRVLVIWLPLWIAPILALWLLMGSGSVYTQEALFFSKAAVVTFGG